jgi:tricorn protease
VAQTVALSGLTSLAMPNAALAADGGQTPQQVNTWTANNAGLPQYPSVTPNGSHVVWSAGGDLFSAPTGGGPSERLTANGANDLGSAISPQGDLLAFESGRDGTTNLYVMPITQRDGRLLANGPIRRITTSDRSQALSGFSSDGSDVLFASTHEPTIFRAPRMYAVSIHGGPVRRLTDAQGRDPRISADGNTLTFTRGYAPWARPAYTGSGNRETWSLDLPTGTFNRLSKDPSNDGQAYTRPNGSTVVVSSRDGQNNLWLIPKSSTLRSARQLTTFAPQGDQATIGHGVRDLCVSADGSTAVFVLWDGLQSLNLNAKEDEAKPIIVHGSGDMAAASTRTESLDQKVTEASLHPSGEAIATVARGEILVRATSGDTPTQRITQGHAQEQHIAWSPNGNTLYYSTDEGGHESIRMATVRLAREDLEAKDDDVDAEETNASDEGEQEDDTPPAEPAQKTDRQGPTTTPKPITKPRIKPAPKPRTKPNLKVKPQTKPKADDPTSEATDANEEGDSDTDTEGEKKKAPKKNTTGDRWSGSLRFDHDTLIGGAFDAYRPQPSPDGRTLLYTRDRGDLVLRDLSTGEDRLLLASWNQPDVQWLPDGRHIVYSVDDLDFNSDVWLMDTQDPESAVNLTRHPDVDHSPRISDDGSFMAFLSDRGRIGHNYEFDVYGMALDPSLLDLPKWKLEERFDAAAKAASGKKLPIVLDADKTPDAVDPLVFSNLDTAWKRVSRLTDATGSESNLYITPDGKRVVFSATIDGTKGLYATDWQGKDRKQLTTGTVGNIVGTPTGKSIAMVASGQAKTVAPAGGSAKTRAISAKANIDVSKEQCQKFAQTARVFGRRFYHPTMKRLDWDALTKRYGELAAQTRTSQAFNRVVNEFFGEVNGSHTGIYGGFSDGGGRTSIGYLGIETMPVQGGYEVLRVLDDGPADRQTGGLEAGDVLTAINDAPLAPGSNALPHVDLGAALKDTSGLETVFDVRDEEGDERIALLTPVSYTAWRNLGYADEIATRQAKVDDASDGSLGYLHIRGMNMPSVHDFERDLYAAAHDKDGLIIDVRDNGGGFTTDILLSSLTAPVHAYTVPRGADVSKVRRDTYPRDRRLLYAYSRPIVVLCNENSFSNAEIFSHAIQTADRGTLIGQETFGGVISTGAFKLIDGTTVREPFRGWFLPDGTDMESRGAIPDIIVERTPAHEASGTDAQLNAAVKQLLREVPKGDPTVKPKPAQ